MLRAPVVAHANGLEVDPDDGDLRKALTKLFVEVQNEMQDGARFRCALALYHHKSFAVEGDVVIRAVVGVEVASEELSRRTRPKPIDCLDGDAHHAVVTDVEKLVSVARPYR